jgi:hypothetical protein
MIVDASSGSILFGGVDTAKYHGDLIALPLQPDISNSTNTPNNITSFNVLLDNIQVFGNGNKLVYSSNLSVSVVLDSGTSLTYLPEEFAIAIANGVGAVSKDGDLIVPCSLASSPATVDFQFGNSNGPVIQVPISQFVLQGSADACSWGILPSAAGESLLFGDTFMRSGYFVYDLDGMQVAMAQTNFNATKNNVVEISAARTIPGASFTATGTVPTTVVGTAATSVGTSTWDLGAPTGTASKPKSAGVSLQPPSKSIITAVISSLVMLSAMIGESLLASVE